jgi:hypothetical protein
MPLRLPHAIAAAGHLPVNPARQSVSCFNAIPLSFPIDIQLHGLLGWSPETSSDRRPLVASGDCSSTYLQELFRPHAQDLRIICS